MTATTTRTAYRSTAPAGRAGFAQLLHAEWTKFRTVRGWLIATGTAALLMLAFGYLAANGSHSTIQTSPDRPAVPGHLYVPIGPGGQAVTDTFAFLHQPLAGDGTLTARISSLTGSAPQQPGTGSGPMPSTGSAAPWAKAGLIVKQNTDQGSTYAAVMVTGSHGVRLQYDYTGDVAGPTGAATATSPRWLRLTRAGQTVTAYTSADASTWTPVGSVRLARLTGTVQVGMFATSPGTAAFEQHLGGGSSRGGMESATAVFDHVNLTGAAQSGAAQSGAGQTGTTGAWIGTSVGLHPGAPAPPGRFEQSGSAYTVTGSGDIAPDVSGQSGVNAAIGTFAMLIVFAVLAVLFITTEYRRGLIRTSLTAAPRRGRLLAAKALVVTAVSFTISLITAAITRPLTDHVLRANGNFIYPVSTLTSARTLVGTAALLALTAVLALAVGTIARRSAAAVTAVVLLVVLPYLLATSAALPTGPSEWLLRITPAAGFAIQQTVSAYPQVSQDYSPTTGFFPLAPTAGLAVTCGWAVLGLVLAGYLLKRRDA